LRPSQPRKAIALQCIRLCCQVQSKSCVEMNGSGQGISLWELFHTVFFERIPTSKGETTMVQ
jgi:hypothetical protein